MKSRRAGPFRSRDGPLYAALVLAWLLLSAVAFAVVLHRDWERLETEFLRYAEHEVITIRDRLRRHQAALDGFAAFLGSVDHPSHAQLAAFAADVLRAEPHLHAIEMVERVTAHERPVFERALALRTGGNGRISRFDYLAGRTWGPVAHKAQYFPVSFVWPETEQSRVILGLDFDSAPHLRAALHSADQSGAAVASEPFELVQGPMAFVMIKPARNFADADASALARHQRFAVLVVRAARLRPETLAPDTDHAVVALTADGRPGQTLFEARAAERPGRLERVLLPATQFNAPDYSTSRAVLLRLDRQMRWRDASLHVLAAVTVVSVAALWALGWYVREHYRKAISERDDHERARFSALHDPLTGLANRSLLRDRIRQALALWHRRREPFALFFLDLDRFKEINDNHGHEAGDAVLREVAARLLRSVRELDTVARIAGDEFVVLVSGTASHDILEALADKLTSEVARPMRLPDEAEHAVTVSLGMSICPDDGEEIDTLLNSADRAMYRYKQRI